MQTPITLRGMRVAMAALITALLIAGCGGDSAEKLVATAKGHMAKREYNTAIIVLKNALEKDVTRGETRLLLGEAMLENGDAKSAEVELQKALDQKMPADDVVPLLLRAYLASGQSKRVIDEYRKFRIKLGTPAARAAALTSLANAHANRGDFADASKAVAEALQLSADNVAALLVQARLAMATQKLDDAMVAADRIVTLDPKNAEGWKLKGDLQGARNEPDQALVSYRKAVEARPNFLIAHQAIAIVLFSQGKNEDAAKELEAMTKIAPKHPLTLSVATQVAMIQKDLKKAQETSQQLLRVLPDAVPALLQAGAIELQLNSYVQAEGFFGRALKNAPGSIAARRGLATVYLSTGEPAKAVEVLKPLQDAIQNDPRMLMLTGEAYMRNGDAARAEEFFSAANKLDPKDARKRTRLAVSKYAQGDAASAMTELEQISASDSGTSADMALIAGHLRRNEFDAALKALAVLEKKEPTSPVSHEMRGRVLQAKRDLAGARKSFERALEVNPAYFPATRGLAQLDVIEKKPKDAELRLEKLAAADPKHSQARLALAALKASSGGTTAEVAELVNKAITARPDELAPRLALIDLYLRAKDARKAIAVGQDAAAAIPNRAEIQEMLGQALLAAGEYNQALSAFAKQAQLQVSSVRPYLRMAEANIIAKNPEAAADNLRKALAMKPDLVEAQRGLIMLDMRNNKGEKSVAMARDIQKQRPTEAIGYILEGDIAAFRKSWADAATAYRNGLKQAPATELAIRLHSVLHAGGNKAEADSFAQGWTKDHPKDYGFQLHLGESAIARGDDQTAATVYRNLLTALPDNPIVYNNLAWVEGRRKSLDAIGYAEKANTIAPNQPAFMDTLAMLLAAKGDLPRATELLGKAVELAPQAAGIRLNYAKVLIQAGKKPEARKELDEITKLGDKFPQQAEVAQLIKTL